MPILSVLSAVFYLRPRTCADENICFADSADSIQIAYSLKVFVNQLLIGFLVNASKCLQDPFCQ